MLTAEDDHRLLELHAAGRSTFSMAAALKSRLQGKTENDGADGCPRRRRAKAAREGPLVRSIRQSHSLGDYNWP